MKKGRKGKEKEKRGKGIVRRPAPHTQNFRRLPLLTPSFFLHSIVSPALGISSGTASSRGRRNAGPQLFRPFRRVLPKTYRHHRRSHPPLGHFTDRPKWIARNVWHLFLLFCVGGGDDWLCLFVPTREEGMDENMAELSALPQLHADALPCSSDASMLDTRRDELLTSDKDGMDSTAKQLLGKTKIGTNGKIDDQLETGSQELNATEQSNRASKVAEAIIVKLRDALEKKSNEYNETESKLNSALEEVKFRVQKRT